MILWIHSRERDREGVCEELRVFKIYYIKCIHRTKRDFMCVCTHVCTILLLLS